MPVVVTGAQRCFVQAFRRAPAAAVVPLLAVAGAAALLFLVALSIVLQPPSPSGTDTVARVLAWARAVLFSAGAVAFLVGIVAFARLDTGQGEVADDGDQDSVDAMPPARERPHVTPAVPQESMQPPRPAAPPTRRPLRAPAWDVDLHFTLIAVGVAEDDTRAIADFSDPGTLLSSARSWRRQYPDEQIRIFGPEGMLLARAGTTGAPAARRLRLAQPPRGGRAAGGMA